MKLKTLGVLISAITLAVAAGTTATAKNVADYQDVKKGDWYYYYVENVSENGLMTGVNDTRFSPSTDLERGQFATVIYRMHGAPDTAYKYQFPDVKNGFFYSVPVTWAQNYGVVGGYEDGTFGPSDKITREQLATMLYRYAQKAGYDVSQTGNIYGFADAGKVSSFAAEGMSWAVGTGIIKGDQGLLNPHGYVSRAVCATMIARLNGIDEAEVQRKQEADKTVQFVGKTGIYGATPHNPDGFNGKINILSVTEDKVLFTLGVSEPDYDIITDEAQIIDSNTAQASWYGFTITFRWIDSERMIVTHSGEISGTDSGIILDVTDNQQYVWGI